jgi:hypothetical protein
LGKRIVDFCLTRPFPAPKSLLGSGAVATLVTSQHNETKTGAFHHNESGAAGIIQKWARQLFLLSCNGKEPQTCYCRSRITFVFDVWRGLQ